MSSESSAAYSDANGSDGNATASGVSSGEASYPPRPKMTSQSSSLLRSESIFLALLFALVALLLPTFFSFAPPPSSDVVEQRESPLKALLPYIPTITTVFRASLSSFQLILRPLLACISFLLALFAPIFLTIKLLYKAFVLLPSRIVAEVVRFLYPVYVFFGVACLFGAGIGLGGRLVVEGGRWIFVQNDKDIRTGRGRIRNS